MKITFLICTALIAVVAFFSSATPVIKKQPTVLNPEGFYVYQGGGLEMNLSSYAYSVVAPNCPGAGPNLCAVLIPQSADTNHDGNLNQTEFYNFVVNYDYDLDGLISDHTESVIVRKKF